MEAHWHWIWWLGQTKIPERLARASEWQAFSPKKANMGPRYSCVQLPLKIPYPGRLRGKLGSSEGVISKMSHFFITLDIDQSNLFLIPTCHERECLTFLFALCSPPLSYLFLCLRLFLLFALALYLFALFPLFPLCSFLLPSLCSRFVFAPHSSLLFNKLNQ